MGERKTSWTVVILGLSRTILHDREMRRKILARLLLLIFAIMAIGLWGIGGWLAKDVLRFTLWWAGCGFLTVMVMLLALYDALAVVREERAKFDE
jgi:peptidoglycan biosynthesis protein MviN/MurJ (putative lipid II flippase)